MRSTARTSPCRKRVTLWPLPRAAPGLTNPEKIVDRAHDRGRSLAEQQVPAIGDHAKRRAEPARVLDAVLQRYPVVVRAPEAETRARHAVEVGARVARDERLSRRDGVGVAR